MTATPEQVARCTTHHLACDCREERVRAVVEALDGLVSADGEEGVDAYIHDGERLLNDARAALRAYRGEDSDAE